MLSALMYNNRAVSHIGCKRRSSVWPKGNATWDYSRLIAPPALLQIENHIVRASEEVPHTNLQEDDNAGGKQKSPETRQFLRKALGYGGVCETRLSL